MATTFTFGGTDITSVATTGTEIKINNIYRPLRNSVTRHKVEIPGKAGSWDFGGGVERDYTVTVDMTIVGGSVAQVMTCADAIDEALDGKEFLIFSDAPVKKHLAQIYSEITLSPKGSGNVVRATLKFECDGGPIEYIPVTAAAASVVGIAPSVTATT